MMDKTDVDAMDCDVAGAKEPAQGDRLPRFTGPIDIDNIKEDVVMQGDCGNDIEFEPDDDSRSEITFRYELSGVSRMADNMLSDVHMVRNLPWRIMLTPRNHQNEKSLGFFLQCNADSDSQTWSVQAVAELRLKSQTPNKEDFQRRISHLFYHKENDWGYSHFLNISELINADRGLCVDDRIVAEVKVVAEAPHGICWDSKKLTGCVGLKNQGATCYLNSLLQTLFFTNKLRHAVYQVPTDTEDPTKSVPLSLQRVFYELQNSDKPVGTKKLTRSFGWEAFDSFMQHDVQELTRVLLDKLETKMKGTSVDGVIPGMFSGKMNNFIKCKEVDYTSCREEMFYDIQLNVKNKNNVYESFKEYVAVETMDGDNRYNAGEEHGLQDAEKGIVFVHLPPVLHLQLMRYQYDAITDQYIKINDKYVFPPKLNLDPFLEHPEPSPAHYTLHAVLVHSGDQQSGHYVVYVDPLADGHWCKFDDDVVSRASKKEAIESNYGGSESDDNMITKSCTSAYMLVYIRDSDIADILLSITDNDIPELLRDKLNEERKADVLKRKEKSEAHLYLMINVITEDQLFGHQGFDLYDPEKMRYKQFRILKSASIDEVTAKIADSLGYPAKSVRLWPVVQRDNHTHRPMVLQLGQDHKTVLDVADTDNPWTVFVEEPHEPVFQPKSNKFPWSRETVKRSLCPYDSKNDVLLFFKFFDAEAQKISYVGHMCVPIMIKLEELFPILNTWGDIPPNTKIAIYEEVISSPTLFPLPGNNRVVDAMVDPKCGDILVYEKQLPPSMKGRVDFFDVREFFKFIYNKAEFLLVDKDDPGEAVTPVMLNLKMPYDEMCREVARHLGADAKRLQFFKPHSFKDIPGAPIKLDFPGNLRDLMSGINNPKSSRLLYYQRISIDVAELENRRTIQTCFLDHKMVENKLTLYPHKGASIPELLEEAKTKVNMNPEGTKRLRLLDISNNKVLRMISDCRVDLLVGRTLRIEEIVSSHLNIRSGEELIFGFHYHKNPYQPFGFPFVVKLIHGESVVDLKSRLKAQLLDLSDQPLDQVRLNICRNSCTTKLEDNEKIDISLFANDDHSQINPSTAPQLGIDHIKRGPKRPRRINEKAIVILN